MMASQQAIASIRQATAPEHYDQVFSAHGTIMIFFVAMTSYRPDEFCGAAAARRARRGFSTLNAVSLWLNAAAILLVNLSLVVGSSAERVVVVSASSELKYSPEWASIIIYGPCRSPVSARFDGRQFRDNDSQYRAPA